MKKIGNFFKKIGLAIGRFFKKIWQKIKLIPTKAKIVYSCLIVGFLAIGGIGGYLLSKQLFKPSIDYSSLNEDEFEDNITPLTRKLSSAKTSSDLTKTFEPVELVEIGINKISAHEYVTSKQYGLVKAKVSGVVVNQTVRASSIKNGNEYFLENISKSNMVAEGRRFYQSGDNVKTYVGSNVEIDHADWPENKSSTLSIQDHIKAWGKDLTRPLIYIVSSKTVENGTAEVTDNGYNVTLELNPIYSVLRYVRQMISISGVSNPVFKSITLDVELDKELNLLKVTSTENYDVDMVVTAATEATLTETFTYDSETKIPTTEENLTYEEE